MTPVDPLEPLSFADRLEEIRNRIERVAPDPG